MGAVHTVSQVGTKAQVSQASEVLVEARKSLYRILAEDEPGCRPQPRSGPLPSGRGPLSRKSATG